MRAAIFNRPRHSPAPPFSTAVNNQTLSVRRIDRLEGPKFEFPPDPPPVPAPWYAAALSPTRKAMALAAADGQVLMARWPFPRPLDGFATDTRPVLIQPLVPNLHPTTSPVYALAWPNTFLSGTPPRTSVFAGGADGVLYRSQQVRWDTIVATAARKPIYAIAAHPTLPVLAIGFGSTEPAPSPSDEWLSVWPESLKPDDRRSWSGHSAPIVGLAFSKNTRLLASLDTGGKLLVWNCRALTNTAVEPVEHASLEVGESAACLTWIERGNETYLAIGFNDSKISLFNVVERPR